MIKFFYLFKQFEKLKYKFIIYLDLYNYYKVYQYGHP